MSCTQFKAEKLIDLLDTYLNDYYYLDATNQSSEEGAEDEIIATGRKLLLLQKGYLPPTKKYNQMFIQIEDCLCGDFLTCDFCKKSGLKLRYYECENIERLVCTECYFLHHRTICAKNAKKTKNDMKKKEISQDKMIRKRAEKMITQIEFLSEESE
jgi:hypothetical protein